ncbi:hypothetical protein [Aquimarina algiphila]|uniref:Uncharacterized protein n=1 Tax=Aquimarina algiphila TaxID=2047982 RepID=A0A554VBJ9_9FLAO|nr:hypothetical protein [Aquimarina algiphila]TSE03936.1 hypothetical protein FOF46_28135 [Aquimarina algiphila]
MTNNLTEKIKSLIEDFEKQNPESKQDKNALKQILDQLDDMRLYSIYKNSKSMKNLFLPRKLKVQ